MAKKKKNNNRLKELRNEKGLTLDEIAELTGIKRGTFSNYENGITEPKLEVWQKLASFFEVPVPYLTGISTSRVDGQIREVAPFVILNDDGTATLRIPEDFEKEIQDTYKKLPEVGQFGFDIFKDIWKNVDDFAFKVPPYIQNAVNLYFIELVERATETDQKGQLPHKKD